MRWSCFVTQLSATGRSHMVVALLYATQSPCNFFTLSLRVCDNRRSNSWRDDNNATMEIKVSRRWWWRSWRCFGDGDQRHKMMMAILYHLYWLHVMFIIYASYSALIDGSIIRWSLTKNFKVQVFSLSMHHCQSSSCRDTTWWSGVISSTFLYNGCKPVLHTRNTQVKLYGPSICRYGLEHLDQKVERESYSRYDQHSDVHHWKLLHLTWWSDMV